MKSKSPTSTHKKVIIELLERKLLRGYLNPTRLPQAEAVDVLTPEGAHEEIQLAKVRAIYFVRDLDEDIEMERKSFLSRPKLDGLWVRLRFRDGESLEGVIPNDLLGLQDNGLQMTPPDFNSNTDRIFVPRSALTEFSVLGVVGIARRKAPAAAATQPRLFTEDEES
ncbi:MAG: hypothetical protein WBL50_21750 [Candidatus Acidiferrum sp.]